MKFTRDTMNDSNDSNAVEPTIEIQSATIELSNEQIELADAIRTSINHSSLTTLSGGAGNVERRVSFEVTVAFEGGDN